MRSPLTLSLLASIALSPGGADAQTAPTADGRYLVTREAIEACVVAAEEAEALGRWRAEAERALVAAGAVVDSARAETAAVRRALAAERRAGRLCEGRTRAALAEAEAARERAAVLARDLERARRRERVWRGVAVASGTGAAVLAGVAVIVLR